MKIAILGSAPSSLGLAPFGDPSWKVWGCSPGVYYQCGSPSAWFELHRWEPPVIGNPAKQRQWFSPEYTVWMAQRDPKGCPVWMQDKVPEIPASRPLPIDDIVKKYGSYFLTSSISIMIACAIEDILEERKAREAAADSQGLTGKVRDSALAAATAQDVIGLWGVDMSATEEYGYQRAGCQHFLLIARDLEITVTVPPESDLLRPMPIYGFCEGTHWHIKNLQRKRELQLRRDQAEAAVMAHRESAAFVRGALDDLEYQMLTWGEDRVAMGMDPEIQALYPRARESMIAGLPAPAPTADALDGAAVRSALVGAGALTDAGPGVAAAVQGLLHERAELRKLVETLERAAKRAPPKRRR